MGYVHLSNALYSADREAWQQIRDSLDREVMADLQYNSEYWAKYDTKVKDISNTVYEDFLESYTCLNCSLSLISERCTSTAGMLTAFSASRMAMLVWV